MSQSRVKKSPISNSHSTTINRANQLFDQQSWFKAQREYSKILEQYIFDSQVDTRVVTHKIQLCEIAMKYNYFRDRGETYMEQRAWNQAISSFEQARKYLHKELPFSSEELDDNISWINQLLSFERYCERGERWESRENWVKAARAYHQALRLHRSEFGVGRQWILSAIGTCELMTKQKSFRLPGILNPFVATLRPWPFS